MTARRYIDCFIFNNELDLLKMRLHELDQVTDFFVIVEAAVTFSGNAKPLHYELNKDMFSQFSDKILHVVVKNMPGGEGSQENWQREFHQRKTITTILGKYDISTDDIIGVSDVDEIPNPETILQIKSAGLPAPCACLEQRFFYYSFDFEKKSKWHQAFLTNISFLKENDPSETRVACLTRQYPFIANGGWHCSYFGDPESIANKIKDFSHQELNLQEFTSVEKIKERITNCRDLFDRGGPEEMQVNRSESDNDLPKHRSMLKDLLKET